MQKYFILLASLLFWTSQVAAKPLIVASIKPLALIAGEIAGDRAEVQTLIPVTGSHHDHPLKVSDHQRLRSADLVMWVGPELESFLQKPLASLPANKLLGAYRLAGLNWPAESHEAGGHHHERDPHLWLDPRNGIVLARAVSENLARLDPANAKYYSENLNSFTAKITKMDGNLLHLLKPVANRGFVVYHEGYSHFVGRFGLRQLNYVTFTPEQKPGAKHLTQLRKDLANEGRCLFLEPYNDMASARDLARELHVKIGNLDPLGSQTVTSYGQLIEQMAKAFITCLGDQ